MAVSRSRVLSLYKAILREAEKFTIYNYRMYALRRIRDSFRENKTVNDGGKIVTCYNNGLKSLEVIKRQHGTSMKSSMSVHEFKVEKAKQQKQTL